MKLPKLNLIFRIFDLLLSPFMWILGGFTFPLQETHIWHMRPWNWKKASGLLVKGNDERAIFSHGSPLGLYHMPIFGGLTKYVVVKAIGFKNTWHIGWGNQIHALPIHKDRIMLLTGKGGYVAYGVGDNSKILKLKVVGYGTLGDNKFKGLRLF